MFCVAEFRPRIGRKILLRALKTGFLCSACSLSTQQTGVSFSYSLNASVFHGFSTVVFDPLMFANDSFFTTSFSTSVLHDFSNLAIGVTIYR